MPIYVVSPEEALANEARDRELRDAGTRGRRTWRFAAENVRDFAWAASPKFIWDAFGVAVPGRDDPESGERSTMCMSFWPSDAEPLWSKYSTQSVAHGIEVYSDIAYPYPYPTAISVNGPVGGMEYPMITFNGPRPEKDGTWSEGTQNGPRQGDHPRGRAQLVPDDHQQRRAAVDVDGRGPQHLRAAARGTAMGRAMDPRGAASRRRSCRS